ncbi:hypothetical protein RKI04_24825 [Citrobacter amalonaticus]|uniref:hypothetical protein n=1 Tax=Citrobacter amalonaticus TaxID=35703 RepID=UPI00287A732D|nr:hypothetical protein [Citrobacter amalonaticus]MDS4039453.1 hypothetical protein [Citrobacter amalonaticus]
MTSAQVKEPVEKLAREVRERLLRSIFLLNPLEFKTIVIKQSSNHVGCAVTAADIFPARAISRTTS